MSYSTHLIPPPFSAQEVMVTILDRNKVGQYLQWDEGTLKPLKSERPAYI